MSEAFQGVAVSGNPILFQMTLRVEPVVHKALEKVAGQRGQEPADYAADILTQHLLVPLDEATADRLRAELDVKKAVIERARELSPKSAFDPDVTLKVFQWIKADPELKSLYERAIGGRPGDERGNPIKARVNRTLGATIKRAVDAASQTIDGGPAKIRFPVRVSSSPTRCWARINRKLETSRHVWTGILVCRRFGRRGDVIVNQSKPGVVMFYYRGCPDEPEGGRRLDPPLCAHCSSLVRPGVVSFGEGLPPSAFLERGSEGRQIVRSDDLRWHIRARLSGGPLPYIAARRGAAIRSGRSISHAL